VRPVLPRMEVAPLPRLDDRAVVPTSLAVGLWSAQYNSVAIYGHANGNSLSHPFARPTDQVARRGANRAAPSIESGAHD